MPELVDTAFIVLRKKPLIFLHWYHHVTVLLYCFHAYKTEAPQALYFVAMNYTVHAVMYGYYCLMALRMKPKWLPPIGITFLQLSQMVVGVRVRIASMVKHAYSPSCPTNFENVAAGGIMYASYFALFFKFLVVVVAAAEVVLTFVAVEGVVAVFAREKVVAAVASHDGSGKRDKQCALAHGLERHG